MTRETKVGMVVAGSFLLLVGIVVFAKWRNGSPPGEENDGGAPPVAAVKPKSDGAKGEPKTEAPAPKKNDPQPIVRTQGSDVVAPPPGFGNDDTIKKKLEEAKQRNPAAPGPLVIAPPPTPGAFPPLDKDPPLGADPKENKPLELPPGLQLPPLGQKDEKNDNVIPPPAPKVDVVGGIPKPADLGGIVVPPLGGGDPQLPEPKDVKIVPPKNDAPALSPPGFPPLKPMDVVKPKDEQPPGLVIQPKDEKPALKDPPLVPPAPPVTIAPPRGLDKDKPQNQEIPTIPAPPRIDSPAVPSITVPNKNQMPVVKDVNADFYAVRPGEKNMGIVSQSLYKSDKYADALLAYNREHNRLVPNGAALMQNPPILSPGQKVLHPPIGILERDYRALIRDGAPTIPGGAPPVRLATPAPIGGNNIKPASTLPPTPSGRVYVVQNPAGESILDIAERTLGNRSEWHRIHALNSQHQPQFRIPAGTQLKLP